MSDSQPTPRRVAVLGGGIAGLSAAHRLVELDPACRVVLWEAGPRLGGVLWTVHEQGFQVEQSADNFITTVPWGLELCRRLGLGDRLIQTNPRHRQTYVVRSGRLYKLPDGFLMMAPTRMWPLAVTPILSPLGKMRAALEYFLPARTDDDDESMAAFARRRLGREVFDRLIEPLVSAVYAADMEKLSVLATLPRFRDMERQHGSLIRAMRKERAARKAHRGESGARYSLFVTLRDGLSSLIDALAARLPPGAVRLNSPVRQIERAAGAWQVTLGDGRAEPFDAVIVATPAHAAARLLEPVDSLLSVKLASIEHSGTAVVTVAYQRAQIAHSLDGVGFVVPAVEKSPILAASFSSQKYEHRAPEGTALIRVFLGGARHPEMAEMDEHRLKPLVCGELTRLLGVRGEPIYSTVARWPRTMPQYHVGHRELVREIQDRADALDGLALAGNYFSGVGIPNCIHTGQQATERILAPRPGV